jgi:two-component system nitrate/nitrite response regulator NarL
MAIAAREPAAAEPSIRVLIVDDHSLFADTIGWTLERLGMTVVGVALTGEQALAIARREHPDLILLDLGLPGMSGTEVGKVLVEEFPDVTVLAVTALDHPRAVKEAIGAGFHGYLTKGTPVAEFADSIRLALAGHMVLPQGLARAAAEARSPGEQEQALLAGQLTLREQRVLTLLAEGTSTEEIAARLSIATNTVRTHVQSILNKLGVHSRLEAVAFGLRYGVIEAPGGAPRG